MCGKKANELESTANSVIVSLETLSPTQLAVQQRFPGEKMCSFSTSHIGGPTNTQTAKDLRRNVHGDERFVVKIQVGIYYSTISEVFINSLSFLCCIPLLS